MLQRSIICLYGCSSAFPRVIIRAHSVGMAQSRAQFYRRKLPDTCIAFHSAEGKQIFSEALMTGHMNIYFSLATQFRTQNEPAFCGLSTLVMVLNTLEVDPKRVWKGVWRWYHEDMLDCCVPLDQAAKVGITMDQFVCLAYCNGLRVKVSRGDHINEGELRENIKELTCKDDEVIVATYDRQTLGQTGTGHFSPIGGYHCQRDLVLIMDTARFKYPPHWVPLPLLCKAMRVIDPETGLPRGCIQLQRNKLLSPMLMLRVADQLSLNIAKPACGISPFSSTIHNFLHRWNQWLCTPVEREEDPFQNIYITALEAFISSLKELDPSDVLLTTQVDIECPVQISPEHCCAVKDLVSSFEKLDIFKEVEDYLREHPDAADIAKPFGIQAIGAQCSRSYRSSDCVMPTLNTAHFISALLLAWPSPKCYQTNGQVFKNVCLVQLTVSSQVLQNEMALLQQQLDSVFAYVNTCQGISCQADEKCKVSQTN